MIAGIDYGCSSTKIVWKDPIFENQFKFRNVPKNKEIETVILEMELDGIQLVRESGIGPRKKHPFEIIYNSSDISSEIKYQFLGLKKVLNKERINNALIVSIGTGTSYTRVLFDKTIMMPIGNSLGGGFLSSIRKTTERIERVGISWSKLDEMACKGKSGDLLIKDIIPNHKHKEFLISNFESFSGNTEDFVNAMFSTVTSSICKDLIFYSLFTKDIYFIGNITNLKIIEIQLNHWCKLLGKNAIFVKNREYLNAIGLALKL